MHESPAKANAPIAIKTQATPFHVKQSRALMSGLSMLSPMHKLTEETLSSLRNRDYFPATASWYILNPYVCRLYITVESAL
jgi:hypothetical protein